MKNYKFKTIGSIFILMLCITHNAYAVNSARIKIFVSNNTHEINVEKAYERITNQYQDALANDTIKLLQLNHIKQGRFENVVGAYQMANDKKITGDNTEIFFASPYQVLSNDQVFSLGKQLANTFQQESVAVFIPSNQSAIADAVIKFQSNQPSITAIIHMIHDKLPAYANAFSLHLSNYNSAFNDAKVSEIEWLGRKININEIRRAFPQDAIFYSRGNAYLVYKNGHIEPF